MVKSFISSKEGCLGEALRYRRLRRSDKKGLCELFYEVFGDGKGTDYWDWKYYQNPAGSHASVIALHGSEVVGILGGIPLRMKVGGDTLLACQGVDTVISGRHRKSSTFFKLEARVTEQMEKAQLAFRYAFTIKETYRLFTTARGFSGVCPIIKMAKVINPRPYLRQKIEMGLLTDMLGGVAKCAIRRWNKKKLSVPEGVDIVDTSRFDHRFDDLWQRERGNYEIAVARNSDYLNWRYVDAPRQYKIFGVESRQVVKGFIALGCYKEEVTRGRILDILVERGQKELVDLLVAEAINYFIDQDVDVITCWMLEGWPAFHVLKEKGFVPRQTSHDLIVRSYFSDKISNEYLADSSRWYVTMGDSDYY